MRLHHLEIQAFGPFADRQTVDFDALSGQGLFLLNGPTGAGKSSVLDAVCFALYGSVPGARQGAKRLRSDHAADGVAPEVCLEFSAGGRRYRVERSPSWDRPARRGGGTTMEQARTLLSEWVSGEWVQKSARNDEAGLELQNLLGMDKDQFTKVVMLPQGEFAAFLRADAKPRRELLQRLFSTDRFEDLEVRFAEQSRQAARELAEQEAEQRNLLLRAVEEAERHDLGAQEPGVDPEGGNPLEAVRGLAVALDERRDAAAGESTVLSDQSALADGALALLKRRGERWSALRVLRGQQLDHDGRGPEVQDASALIRRHEEARGLATVLRLDDEASAAAGQADDEHRRSVERLRANTLADTFIDSGADAFALDEATRSVLVSACTAASSAVVMLRAALPEESRLLGVQAELGTCASGLATIEGRADEVAGEIGALQVDLETTAERLAVARRASEGLDHLRSVHDAAHRAEGVVVRFGDAEQRRVTAEAAHQEAAERFLTLKERWLTAVQRRLEQAAVELAEGLEAGEPCSVCGSADHPAPATSPGGERVTLADEQAARHLQAEAEATLLDLRGLLDAIRLEVADLAARGGASTREDAADRTHRALSAVLEAESAATLALELQESIDDARSAEKVQRTLQDELQEERSAVMARQVSLLDQEAALTQRLLALQEGAPSVSARLASVERASEDLDAVRLSLDAQIVAEGALRRSRSRVDDALKVTVFDTAATARTALLDDDEQARLTALVTQYQAQGHRLEAGWSEAGIQQTLHEEADGVVAPTEEDERSAARSAESLRARAQTAGISAEVLGQSVAQLHRYARRLADLEVVVAPLRERALILSGLADTARGGGENLLKMSLATYVLASRLEQVAAAATERLLQMSDGRYALVHSDATSGNKRSGLGLNVIDGWTGNRRDTATLSGGESFMASLALALGLADVVQQESGGLDIETLFVDEGFGSLDDQALEQVMDALEGLRSGGRVVGLVSHVPELKQRVGAQLQVVKGRQGSTLRFVEQPVSV